MGTKGALTLATTTACSLSACFPSFEGLSSGSRGGAFDSGQIDSTIGGESSVNAADVDEGLPRTVLDCNSLGRPGDWQDVTPPQVDLSCSDAATCANGAKAFVVDPRNAGVLYLGVDGQGLWKSSDCGGAWTLVNTGKNGILVGATDFGQLEIDPVDSRILYTRSYSNEFKSTDGGVSWETIWPSNPMLPQAPADVESLAIDPGNHEHLLIDFRDSCTAEYAPSCIAESHDGGASWALVKTPGTNSYAQPWFIDSTTWLIAAGGLWRSTDSGANWQALVNSGLIVTGRLYRTKGGSYYLGSDLGVLFSTGGAAWSLMPNSGSKITAGVVGDGTTVYTSAFGTCSDWGSNLMTFSTAPEEKGRPWTTMSSPPMTHGASDLGYDPVHHILYSSHCRQGFWRVATQ
jgi:hypothetical protein